MILIELDDFYTFDQSLYQADVELDGQIQSMIEDFIEEEGAEELCLEDIYLAMIEGEKIFLPFFATVLQPTITIR